MGAYEFQPVTAIAASINFGVQMVGTHHTQNVVLTNQQLKSLSISSTSAGGDFSVSSACPPSLAASGACTITVTFTPSTVGPRAATLTVNDDDTNGPRNVPLSGIGIIPGTAVIVSVSPAIEAGSSFTISGLNFTPGSRVNFFIANPTGSVNAGPIGAAISVTSVTQAGTTVTVNGTGFSTLTVINLFNSQSGGVVDSGWLQRERRAEHPFDFG